MPASKTKKAERTRAKILETALDLFIENGFEKTTMRDVASAAGVSVGNAYYYFSSKEHLVQGFYQRLHQEHLAVVQPALPETKTFRDRLSLVLTTKIETAEPYHSFSGLLFQSAANPKSPLNPFSPESGPVRDEAIALMSEVISGSKERVAKDLAAELPRLLWLYEMSIILFWIHDESKGRARTQRMIERTVDMVARLVKLSSNPLMAPLRKSALRLLEDLASPT